MVRIEPIFGMKISVDNQNKIPFTLTPNPIYTYTKYDILCGRYSTSNVYKNELCR